MADRLKLAAPLLFALPDVSIAPALAGSPDIDVAAHIAYVFLVQAASYAAAGVYLNAQNVVIYVLVDLFCQPVPLSQVGSAFGLHHQGIEVSRSQLAGHGLCF